MKVLITGSRQLSDIQIEAIKRYIKERIMGKPDILVIVGDSPKGADAAVIRACDEAEVPIEVHGGYGRMRIKTWTGKNVAHDTDYPGRDRIMAEMLGPGDRTVTAWNGVSKKSGTYATARYASKSCGCVYWLLEKPGK